MFWHFVCSFSQRRNVTLNINCVLAGSKFWSSTTDKEKHRDSSEFHGGGWWSKQKGSHADQQWSICHSYYWRVSILDLVVSDCLPDHICQFLQFYKTTMGSDLNMSMLLMILCFLCLVKLMPSGRKRSHHSCPKINLHPRRKKIQYPDELLCLICKDLMTDAVVIPCCGNSYCDECKCLYKQI